MSAQIEDNINIPNYNLPIGSIVESDSNANGSYIKYADGTMMCYGYVSASIVSSDWSQEGSIYRAKIIPNNNKPFAVSFIGTPIVVATMTSDSSLWGFLGNILADKDRINYMYMYRGTTSSTATGYFNYTAIGRWK